MTILFRLWIVLTTIFVPFASADELNELTPEDQFRQAETWYRVARATENGMEFHERAAKLYESVISRTNDPVLKAKAEKGADQVFYRNDNAHDTYRTLFDPVWWMSKQDSTIEWYDDVYMLALGNAWAGLEANLSRELDAENHAVLAFVTRNEQLPSSLLDTGSEDFEANRTARLKLMRDEVVGLADANSSLVGVPDDLLPWDINWLSKPNLSKLDIQKFCKQLNTQGVVLVHVNIDDEIPPSDEYLGVVRTSLAAYFWRHTDAEPYAIVKSMGVGQDAKAHHPMAVYWLLSMLSVAVGLSVWTARKRLQAEVLSYGQVVFTATILFALGGVWSHLSFAFATDYQVDWGQASLILETDQWQIPYIPSMQWSWVLALVALSSPALVLAWALDKIDVLVHGLIPVKELQFPILLPSMLTGVLAWLFLPLVMAHTFQGWSVACSMSLGVLALVVTVAPMITKLFEGGSINRLAIVVVLCLILLSLSLPLGLFNNWHWGVSVAMGLSAIVLHRQQFESAEHEVQEDIQFVEGDNPFLQAPLIKSHASLVKEITETLNARQACCIVDDCNTGRSPIFMSLYRQLHTSNASNHNDQKVLYFSCEESDAEPFAFVHRLMSRLGLKPSLKGQVEANGNIVTDSVDSLVTALPGVEFIMGLIGETTMGLSREMIVEDLTRYVLSEFHKYSTVYLLLDNADHIDDASREVLTNLLQKSSNVSVVWEVSTEESMLNWNLDSNATCTLVPKVSKDDFEQFLVEMSVVSMPTEVQEEILQITNGDFQQIVAVLQYLYDEKHVQKDMDNQIHFVRDIRKTPLHKIVPTSYERVELERFHQLDELHQRIVECASVCGNIFYAEEIAFALNTSEVKALEMLEKIERQTSPSIVFDVPGESGVFQFHSRLTQLVIAKQLRYAQLDLPKELAVRFHKRILQGDSHDIPLFRLLFHATQIRHLEPQMEIDLLVEYIQILTAQFAWPEIVELYQEPDYTGVLEQMSTENWVQSQISYAKALRYHPNLEHWQSVPQVNYSILAIAGCPPTSNLHAGVQVLTKVIDKHLQSDVPVPFELIKTWCQLAFVPTAGQEYLKEVFAEYAEQLISHLEGVERYFVESYYHSVFKFERNITSDLQQLVSTLDALPTSDAQQFALGSVLKEFAGQHFHHSTFQKDLSVEEIQNFWDAEIAPLYQRANQLMEEQGDWHGLAASYGIQANMYLFTLKDYPQALELLQQDLDLVERFYFVSYESSIRGRISVAYQRLLELELNTEPVSMNKAQYLYQRALNEAESAHSCALRLGADRDASMAESSLQHIERLKEQLDALG